MPNLKEQIIEVLEQGYVLSLGTLDTQGVWVADVIYTHDEELNIYWMSYESARHSKAIATNNKVAGTITVREKEDDLGLQIEGNAQLIKGNQELAKRFQEKRNRPLTQNEEILNGRKWYCLKPTLIQLLDKKKYGHEKKTVHP